MGSYTKNYLGKANTSEEKRNRRKTDKGHPYAKKAMSYDEYEADWLVSSKKYRRSALDAVDSDLPRDRARPSYDA